MQVPEDGLIMNGVLDEAERKARIVRRLVHPAKISAHAVDDEQRLDDGNLVVGWGAVQRTSEFSDDDTLLLDATLPGVSQRVQRPARR